MTRPNPDDVVATLDAVGTIGCKATVQQFVPTSSHGGMRAILPSDNPDTFVSFSEYAKLQSLLLAAREECEGWRQRYLAMCALAGESELGDKQMQMEIEDATERAERAALYLSAAQETMADLLSGKERAEAELAECRRLAKEAAVIVRWYAEEHPCCPLSAKGINTLAAIDACVGGEE